MNKTLRTLKALTARTVAFIILKISVTGGGAALLGADRVLALTLAAFTGILEVAEEISRNYLTDGKIDTKELDKSFKDLANKTQKEK